MNPPMGQRKIPIERKRMNQLDKRGYQLKDRYQFKRIPIKKIPIKNKYQLKERYYDKIEMVL